MDKVAHLQMVQAVIARMASNSFLLKGWSVTLVSALLALATQTKDEIFIAIAILPALAFWDLDAFYLRQERLFRKLYETICRSSDQEIICDAFSLSTSQYEIEVPTWFNTFCSPSILIIHGTVMALIVSVLIVLHFA